MMIAVRNPLVLMLMSLLQPAAQARRKRQVMGADELRAMTDHELKDLGIGRGEVEYWLQRGDATSP